MANSSLHSLILNARIVINIIQQNPFNCHKIGAKSGNTASMMLCTYIYIIIYTGFYLGSNLWKSVYIMT